MRNLEQLLAQFYSTQQACFYNEAVDFFAQYQEQQRALHQAELVWKQSQQAGDIAEVQRKNRSLFTDLQFEDEKRRIRCWTLLRQAAEALLKLSEGTTPLETQTASARLLGGLLMTASSNKRKTLLLENAYKPCYRALLTLRLLEDLLEQNILKEPLWQEWYQERNVGSLTDCPYRQKLQIPIVMGCIIQHAGLMCLPAQQLLAKQTGGDKAERALTQEQRQELLSHCLTGSLDLLKYGLGELPYRGNKREERDLHQQQHERLLKQLQRFISAKPNTPLGSLFKVPQAYASVALPGRPRYNYDALPKAALLMRDGVQRGDYHGVLVDRLFRIVGLFPQGYGVVFTPLGDDGKPQMKYEFAIVNTLYPEKPDQPGCRVVSRNMQYRNTGHNISLSSELNLFFKPARDRLKRLPEERLKELLNILFKDGEENYMNVLLPKCWYPESFFSVPENQNLWQTVHLKQN